MSLSRFTRGLISSHMSARSTPLWDQIEVAMMEPETEKKRKRARPSSTKTTTSTTTTTTPTTAVAAPPRVDTRPRKGRAGTSQPAGTTTRAERRSALRQARASQITAAADEPGPGNATFETERSACDTAGRNNRVYPDTPRGVRTSLLLPNTASASTSRTRSPANRSAPSPRETKIELSKAFANLEDIPPSSAVDLGADAGPPEFGTSRGRAPKSDMPWPDRAPRRERQRQHTAQVERPSVKDPSAQRNRKRSQVENTPAARGQWSVAREPNIRVDATCVHVLRARNRVRAHVERSVQRVFGSHYTVEFFGSTRYGVSHSHSDLDMVIIDPERPQGYREKVVKESLYNVRTLAKALRRAGFIHVDFRMHSSVPIVKFKDASTGLDCDLNVNERLGIQNSEMINEYCALSPVLRPLLFSIKEWAKPLGLNTPSGGLGIPVSFSSYALTLMTIAFLQERGILPNLQDGLPPLEPEDSETLVWTRKPHHGWDARFNRDQVGPTQPDADEQALLHDWFRHWETFPYDQKAAAIRHGGMLQRTSPLLAEVPRRKPPAPVVVVDPFIASKNVAVGVAGRVLTRFQEECGKAAERMGPGPAS